MERGRVSSSSEADLLSKIADGAALLHLRLSALAEDLHQATGVSAGERAILRSLVEHGPLTVPTLAAMRPVSRQYVQRLVDALLDRELVALKPNPAHKRSPRIAITPRGRATLRAMLREEARFWQDTADSFRRRDLATALDVVERLNDLALAELQAARATEKAL
jgi:DNA-binding MarR family transcriptional regulator